MDLNEIVRRFVMAGVGAVSYTFDKSKDLADALVKKGEETAAENNVSYEQVRDQVAELQYSDVDLQVDDEQE